MFLMEKTVNDLKCDILRKSNYNHFIFKVAIYDALPKGTSE